MISWTNEADAKLFFAILQVHHIKMTRQALNEVAELMGQDCSPKAISHRITKLRARASRPLVSRSEQRQQRRQFFIKKEEPSDDDVKEISPNSVSLSTFSTPRRKGVTKRTSQSTPRRRPRQDFQIESPIPMSIDNGSPYSNETSNNDMSNSVSDYDSSSTSNQANALNFLSSLDDMDIHSFTALSRMGAHSFDLHNISMDPMLGPMGGDTDYYD